MGNLYYAERQGPSFDPSWRLVGDIDGDIANSPTRRGCTPRPAPHHVGSPQDHVDRGHRLFLRGG